MEDDIYQEIVRVMDEGEEAALVTIISASGSSPREEGAKMLVRTDGSIMGSIGGGSLEAKIIEEAIGVIGKCKSQRFCYHLKEGEDLGMLCGGDVDVFIEPILSAPTLYIFGGGHIALPLAKMARLAGFKTVVIDDRPEFATPERFPEAEQTLSIDFDKAFQKLKIGKSGYIVIITHGHKGDEVVLREALATKANYIGMIGSETKNKVVYSHLLAQGATKEQLDTIHAPIGLPISAQTPDEIAVSILAEIIQIRRSNQESQTA